MMTNEEIAASLLPESNWVGDEWKGRRKAIKEALDAAEKRGAMRVLDQLQSMSQPPRERGSDALGEPPTAAPEGA